MSIFDWVTSLIGAVVIGVYVLRLPRSWMVWAIWLLLWILFGILVHRWMGVDTMLGYYVGLNPKPSRPAQSESKCPFA